MPTSGANICSRSSPATARDSAHPTRACPDSRPDEGRGTVPVGGVPPANFLQTWNSVQLHWAEGDRLWYAWNVVSVTIMSLPFQRTGIVEYMRQQAGPSSIPLEQTADVKRFINRRAISVVGYFHEDTGKYAFKVTRISQERESLQ